METQDHVLYYFEGQTVTIVDSETVMALFDEGVHLLETANDTFLKSITPADLEHYKETGAIELVFSVPREVAMPPKGTVVSINRLLVPLFAPKNSTMAMVLYADPDYEPFNALLNSKGTAALKGLLPSE